MDLISSIWQMVWGFLVRGLVLEIQRLFVLFFLWLFLTFAGLRLDPRNRRILPLYSQLHRRISRRNSGTPEGIWGIQSTCQGKQWL